MSELLAGIARRAMSMMTSSSNPAGAVSDAGGKNGPGRPPNINTGHRKVGAGGDRRSTSFQNNKRQEAARDAIAATTGGARLISLLKGGTSGSGSKRKNNETNATTPRSETSSPALRGNKRSRKSRDVEEVGDVELNETPRAPQPRLMELRNLIEEISTASDDESDKDSSEDEVDAVSDDEVSSGEEDADPAAPSASKMPKWLSINSPVNDYLKHFGKCISTDGKWQDLDVNKCLEKGQFSFLPNDPVNSTMRDLLKGTNPGAKHFYNSNAPMIFWDVEKLYPKLVIPCVKENCRGVCKRKNIARYPRRVIGMHGQVYLWSIQYRCQSCSKEFSTTNKLLLQKLPLYVQHAYPCVLSKRSGLMNDVVKLLISGSDVGLVPTKLHNLLLEFHSEKATILESQYYNFFEMYMKMQPSIGQVTINRENANQTVEVFRGSYCDALGLAGQKVPSPGYLLYHFKSGLGHLKSFMLFDMQSRGTHGVLAIDHTFKLLKKMGDKTFNAIFDAQNKLGEVRMFAITTSTEFDMVKEYLRSVEETSKILNQEPVRYVFSDLCCGLSSAIFDVFPGLLQGTSRRAILPIDDAEIVLVDSDSAACDVALESLWDTISNLPDGESILVGMDTEYINAKEEDRDKFSHQICLIQMAFRPLRAIESSPVSNSIKIVMIHIKKGKISPLTRNVLQSEKLKLSGRGIVNDIRLINRNFDMEIKDDKCLILENVFVVNNLNRRITDRRASLQKLLEEVLDYTLEKEEDVRRTNWGKAKLNEKEKLYGARDALASFLLGERFEKLLVIKQYREESLRGDFGEDEKVCTEKSIEKEEQDEALNQENRMKISTRLLLDAIHGMWRITDLIPKKHPFRNLFMVLLRDTILTLNQDDVKKFDEVYKKIGSSFEDEFRYRSKRTLNYIRRTIITSDKLRPALETLINDFSAAAFVDPKTGAPLLSEKAIEEAKKFINVHVAKGCLSDPPISDLDLYYDLGPDKDGLHKYYCCRGTSNLEGLHSKLNRGATFYNAGVEYIEAYCMYIIFRRNLRISAKRRLDYPFPGHYSTWLYTHINKSAKAIYGRCIHLYWNSIVRAGVVPETNEPFGVLSPVLADPHYVKDEASLKKLNKNVRFLVERQKQYVPFKGIHNKAEKWLFKKTISKYIIERGQPDFDIMAEHWNSGEIKLHISVTDYTSARSDPVLTSIKAYVRAGCTIENGIFKKTATMLSTYYQDYTSKLQLYGLLEAAKTNIKTLTRKVKMLKKKGVLIFDEEQELVESSSSDEEDEDFHRSVPPPSLLPLNFPNLTLESGGRSTSVLPLPLRALSNDVLNEESQFATTAPIAKSRAPRKCKKCGQSWDPITRIGCIASQPKPKKEDAVCRNPPLPREEPPLNVRIISRKATPSPQTCKNCGSAWNASTRIGCQGAVCGVRKCKNNRIG